MPTEQQRTFDAARQIKRLQQFVGDGPAVQRENLADQAASSRDFMKSLNNQLGLNTYERAEPVSNPSADTNAVEDREEDQEFGEFDNPWSDYLVTTAHMISDGAREMRRMGRAARGADRQEYGPAVEIVCCIVSAIYELVDTEQQRQAREALEDFRREAFETDVVKWIKILRDILVAIRRVGASSIALASFQLSILKLDFSAQIFKAIRGALAGVLMMFIGWVEMYIGRLNRKMMEIIERVRCPPIVRIWTAILDWLYNRVNGLIGRFKSFVLEQLTQRQRDIQGAFSALPSNASGSVGLTIDGRSFELVDDLILLLNAILDALELFEVCRIPEPEARPDEDEDDRSGRRDRGRGGRDRGSDDREETGRRAVDAGGVEVEEDEDLGTVAILRPSTPDRDQNRLFLTPTNVAKFAVREFDADPQEARRLARGQTCRQEISEETESVLEEIGIFTDDET